MTQPQPNAFIDVTPVPQRLTVYRVSEDPFVLAVMVEQSLVSHLVLLDRASGIDLANKLREQCSGLTVATDLPPGSGNGQHGGGA